ncbi:MAG: hypothetical protein ACTHJR_12265 [Sphingomonas sp.]|uniref:hypothetical protein n=1 Tax=Sphingomonas sp. TaxID=28214 RepID=UPI003F8013DA
MPQITQRSADALKRTIDWARAHPDLMIKDILASKRNGDSCEPTDPEAHCFCAIGRLAKELDVDVSYNGYQRIADALGVERRYLDRIISGNDWSFGDDGKLNECHRIIADRRGIDRMDDLLKHAEIVE